jgi:spore coat polysaccharide biosynthesis protein SpsF (cytidylyltransferase family)
MGSQRLPGKMMREVLDAPLIGHLLQRVRQAKKIDGMVVATPQSPANDVVAEYCTSINVPCFRGSENDVVGRMLGALESEHADIGVKVYGDSPLIDPALINECITAYLGGGYDWVGNDIKGTYPSGMYTEAFSIQALRDSVKRTTDPSIREHATLFLRQHPELYMQKNIEATGVLRRPDVHLEVDTEEDFTVFQAIVEHFAPRKDETLEEILQFLDDHPSIAASNRNVERRWKRYQRN